MWTCLCPLHSSQTFGNLMQTQVGLHLVVSFRQYLEFISFLLSVGMIMKGVTCHYQRPFMKFWLKENKRKVREREVASWPCINHFLSWRLATCAHMMHLSLIWIQNSPACVSPSTWSFFTFLSSCSGENAVADAFNWQCYSNVIWIEEAPPLLKWGSSK